MPLVADDRILRTGLVAAAAAVALSVLLGTLGDPWRAAVAAAVTVLLVALGSPHGALDHLVLVSGSHPGQHPDHPLDGAAGPAATGAGRVLRRLLVAGRGSLRGLGGWFVAGYGGLALLSLVAYLLAPRAGFALFLVLSVAHFAAGEAGVAVDRGLARGWGDPVAWTAALGGAVVVVLPLASAEAAAAVAAVDPRLAPVLSPLQVMAPVVVALTVAALLGCLVAAHRGSSRAPVVAVELMALTALAVLADPLLAFAAYFAFWHSLRHQARLAQLLRGPGGGPAPRYAGRPLQEVVGSALAGVPATLGVLGGAVVLALTGTTLLGGLLAVIWALTVPHSCAVVVMEVRAARRRRAGAALPLPGGGHGGEHTGRHDVQDGGAHGGGRGPGTGSPAPASNGHDTLPATPPLGAPPAPRALADGVRG